MVQHGEVALGLILAVGAKTFIDGGQVVESFKRFVDLLLEESEDIGKFCFRNPEGRKTAVCLLGDKRIRTEALLQLTDDCGVVTHCSSI